MHGFWKRFAASYLVSLLALYVAIAIVAVTGAWRNDFFHVRDNLCTALVLCAPNAFFGATLYRKFVVAVFFGAFTAVVLVMIALVYKHYLDELRLFWPVWVTLIVVVLASLFAYPPCVDIIGRSLPGGEQDSGNW